MECKLWQEVGKQWDLWQELGREQGGKKKNQPGYLVPSSGEQALSALSSDLNPTRESLPIKATPYDGSGWRVFIASHTPFSSLSFPPTNHLYKYPAISHTFCTRELEDLVGWLSPAPGGMCQLECFQLRLSSIELGERNTLLLYKWGNQELFMICPKLHSQ